MKEYSIKPKNIKRLVKLRERNNDGFCIDENSRQFTMSCSKPFLYTALSNLHSYTASFLITSSTRSLDDVAANVALVNKNVIWLDWC